MCQGYKGNREAVCQCDTVDIYDKDNEGHIKMRLSHPSVGTSGVLQKYFSISGKTPLYPGKKWLVKTMLEQLSSLLRNFGILVDEKMVTDLFHKEFVPWKGRYSVSELAGALREIDFLEVLELDKNNYSFVMMCRKNYMDKLWGAFDPGLNKQYVEVVGSDKKIKQGILKEYDKWNLAKTTKKDCEFNRAKILLKNKDLGRNRPVVSFFNFVGRYTGKFVSRAMTVIVRRMQFKWKQFNLDKNLDFRKSIDELNNNKKWRLALKDEYTFIECDIKEQYSNLCMKDLLNTIQEVKLMIGNEGNGFVRIAKDKKERFLDGIGKGGDRHFINVSFDVIWKYVLFELENNYILVGSKTVKQVDGVAMGSLCGAQLAVLDCMRKENESRGWWAAKGVRMKAWRFRDDIRLMVKGKLGDVIAEDYVKRLNLIYGSSVKVELEACRGGFMMFLDYRVELKNGILLCRDVNRNIDMLNDGDLKKWKIRFPVLGCGWNKKVYLGVMVGVMLNAFRICNCLEMLKLSIEAHVKEFLMMGYNVKWIKHAAALVNLKLLKLVIVILKNDVYHGPI
jgi:hypothetical protein